MASFNSDQIAAASVAANGNNFRNALNEVGAKLRIAFFSILTTGSASGDTLNLATLPKGAKIIGGQLITEALGASVTLSLGTDTGLTTGASGGTSIAAGAANLLAATSVASASNTAFAATYALGAGAETTGVTSVYATVGGATPTTAKQIQGWVTYVQNS